MNRKRLFLFYMSILIVGVYTMDVKAQNQDMDKEIALKTADAYLLDMRKWEKGSYKLRYRCEKGGRGPQEWPRRAVSGHLLKDYEDTLKFHAENPNIVYYGYYPSEFVLVIDVVEKKVVEDFRHGQKELHPRP